jgi:hypothetical protein
MITFYVYGNGSARVDVAHTTNNGTNIIWEHDLLIVLAKDEALFNDHANGYKEYEERSWSYDINDVGDFYDYFNRDYTISVTLEAATKAKGRAEAVEILKDLLQIELDDLNVAIEMEEE